VDRAGAYLLARDAWGVGYATEAAGAIRDVGLTIRPDLVSLIYPDNTASIAGHELGLYRSPVAS
jgi:RimJ/RimL family protein N-acetyltransferase